MEVFFFVGFFWVFYYFSFVLIYDLGGCWFLIGILLFNFLEVLLFNILVFLVLGVLIIWVYYSFIEGKWNYIN